MPRPKSDDNQYTPDRVARDFQFSYKQPAELRRYVTDQGYILPRSQSKLTLKQQRQLAREVKRARHLGLIRFTQTV